MNRVRWMLVVLSALGIACTPRPDPPANLESVTIVLYHPLAGWDALKTVGDWAMLSSGELVQVETNTMLSLLSVGYRSLPVSESLIEPLSGSWIRDSDEIRGRGQQSAQMSRTTGVICVEMVCRQALVICPPRQVSMTSSARCKGFLSN